jgi:deoxyribose-phosphate aldolase
VDVKHFLGMVDHTLLKPEATREQITSLCEEARELSPASVCVNGLWVAHAVSELDGSDVAVCSVVGFPLGSMAAVSVARETEDAVDDGAREIDMVVPLGLLKGSEDEAVRAYVGEVRSAADGVLLKVIIESAVLEDDEVVRACELSVAAGADFVKTSTGFHAAGGATESAVRLMRETVGDDVGVKASGGIRTRDDVERMVAAGASRLGMSAAAAVAAEFGAD